MVVDEVVVDLGWKELAACARTNRRLDFFAEIPSAEVVQTCASCPVVDACRNYALQYEPYGYWGGMTENQREAERRNRSMKITHIKQESVVSQKAQNKPLPNIIHGTPGGYQQERKRGVAPCKDCLTAHRNKVNEYRKAKKANKA